MNLYITDFYLVINMIYKNLFHKICQHIDDISTYNKLELVSKKYQKMVLNMVETMDDTKFLIMIHKIILPGILSKIINNILTAHFYKNEGDYHQKFIELCTEDYWDEYGTLYDIFEKYDKLDLLYQEKIRNMIENYSYRNNQLHVLDSFDKITFYNKPNHKFYGSNTGCRYLYDGPGEYTGFSDEEARKHPITFYAEMNKKDRSITIEEFYCGYYDNDRKECLYTILESQYDKWYTLKYDNYVKINGNNLDIHFKFKISKYEN